jgi:hypothetical protein
MSLRDEFLWGIVQEYALPALIGSGGLIAWFRAWWRRRKKRKRLEKARAEAIRKLLDTARYQLFLMTQPDEPVDKGRHEERMWELRHDIGDCREELWEANGNRSKRRRDV